MKKSNNYGFTAVELIISFAIAIPLLMGLYKIVDAYREKQLKIEYEKEIISYKNDIINAVQTDINTYGLKEIKLKSESCNGYENSELINGIEIHFKDSSPSSSPKLLCIYNVVEDDEEDDVNENYAYIVYANIKYEVPNKFVSFAKNDIVFSQSKYDNIVVLNNLLYTNEKVYTINIKMKHSEISKDFSIHMVFITRDNSSSIPGVTPPIGGGGSGIKFTPESINYLNDIKNGTNHIGDDLQIKDEKFEIIEVENDTVNNKKIVKAFAKNNIYVGKKAGGQEIPANDEHYGLQNSNTSTTEFYEDGCGFDLSSLTPKFVNIYLTKRLQEDNVTEEEKQLYQDNEYKKVYKSESKIWSYLNAYSVYLNQNEDGYKIVTRLPDISEVSNDTSWPHKPYDKYKNTHFWVGTAFRDGMYIVNGGHTIYATPTDCAKSDSAGVRPMIEIELDLN